MGASLLRVLLITLISIEAFASSGPTVFRNGLACRSNPYGISNAPVPFTDFPTDQIAPRIPVPAVNETPVVPPEVIDPVDAPQLVVPSVVKPLPPPAPTAPAPTSQVFASQNLRLRVVQQPTYQILQINGVIWPQDNQVYTAATDSLVAGKRLVVSMMNFGGGSYGPTIDLGMKLRAKCSSVNGCEIRTEVPPLKRCSSNCITLYMIGKRRYASESSVFGFHAASLGTVPQPGAVEGMYWKAGVSAKWLSDHAAIFKSTTITPLHPNALNGSGIVTHLVRVVPPAAPATPMAPKITTPDPVQPVRPDLDDPVDDWSIPLCDSI